MTAAGEGYRTRIQFLRGQSGVVFAVRNHRRHAAVYVHSAKAGGEQIRFGHFVAHGDGLLIASVFVLECVTDRLVNRALDGRNHDRRSGRRVAALRGLLHRQAAADIRNGFLRSFQPGEGQGHVDGCGTRRGAVQRGVGLRHAQGLHGQAVLLFTAQERYGAVSCQLRAVGGVIQGQAKIDIRGNAPDSACDAQHCSLGNDMLPVLARADFQLGSTDAYIAGIHQRAVLAADIGHVNGRAYRHSARADGRAADAGFPCQDGGSLHASCQGDGHLVHRGDIPDEVQAQSNRGVDGDSSHAGADAGYLHIPGNCAFHGQRLSRHTALTFCVCTGGISADIRSGVQLVDHGGHCAAHSRTARCHGDDEGFRVAAEFMGNGDIRVGNTEHGVLADRRPRARAVDRQRNTGVHRHTAGGERRRGNRRVGFSRGMYFNGRIHIRNARTVADSRRRLAVEVRHAEGYVDRGGSAGNHQVRGEYLAKVHGAAYFHVFGPGNRAVHIRGHIGEHSQGRTADANARGAAGARQGNQADGGL